MTTLRHVAPPLLMLAGIVLAGCGKKVPPDVQVVLNAQRAAARAVATDAAKLCPPLKASAPSKIAPSATALAISPTPNPAKGTALEADAKIVDVFVMCQWHVAKDPSMLEGTGTQSLRGTSHVPLRAVTMPEDRAETSCKKNASDCEEVIVPSRFSAKPDTADLRIVKPTSDGETVEVTVVIVP